MNRRFARENAAPRDLRAFTLIELLVVIAIIAILASLLIPGLVRSKRAAHAIVCLNNVKQFAYAWKLYTQDNEERLPPNAGGMYGGERGPSWVNGLLDPSRRDFPDNTNIVYLQTSLLTPYVGSSVQTWRCPSDKSTAWEETGWYPRIRSYTMNALLDSATVPTLKTTTLYRPSQVFLFLDEREDSILDCKFKMILDYGPDKLAAIPGSYHNGSAGLSFADGHAENIAGAISARIHHSSRMSGSAFLGCSLRAGQILMCSGCENTLFTGRTLCLTNIDARSPLLLGHVLLEA